MKTSNSTLALALLIGIGAQAQSLSPERIEALHARPSKEAHPPVKSGILSEYFIYAYDSIAIPIVDDFSVDRTRHLNASSSDAGVTLTETIYQLQVGGAGAPDMAFMLDSSFHYTVVDTVGVDSIVQVANPQIEVVIFNFDTWPVTTDTLHIWPYYFVQDTVGDPTSDTLDIPGGPDIVQDSLMVYSVDADTRTYTNPDNSTGPLILWETDAAYVNGTYPIEPPTIGVASFDGMDRTGYPYEPENPNSEGLADVMTSVPIQWNGASVADSIYLSFFYQPQGRSGDVDVDASDSLYLELYSPSQDLWFSEWKTPYTEMMPFKQVMVPIVYEGFVQDGFRMRFSNRATLGGAVDHWHIDYVRLNTNRSSTDTLLQDVAWAYPVNTLLSTFTSVPYNKYVADPGHYMAPTIDLAIRNLFNNDATITWNYEVQGDCVAPAAFSNYGTNFINNANSTFISNHPITDAPNGFSYDIGGCADAAFAEVSFRAVSNPDALAYNDTTNFTQEFSNYYSYDDGSAEQGYWLNVSGGRIAYRFDTQGQDSLRAVRMYFDPIFTYGDIPNDPRDGSFLVTVWQDLDSEPIFQNISFSSPEYRQWGPDHFVEYELDSTIAVGGTFYVGWTQTNAVKMNLGLDKNRVNNDKMFYNVGDVWQQSQASGSWMLRPVMVSAVDPFASVPETSEAVMDLFPNPAMDQVRVRFTGVAPRTIELLDATGRHVSVERYRPDGFISVGGMAEGLYVVRALDADGRAVAQQRLIVQR